MKKYILYGLAIIFFIGIMQECVNSCSGDDENEKKGEQTSDSIPQTISEALEVNDFQRCNELLNRCFGSYEYMSKAAQVLRAQASYLMDMDDPETERLFKLCVNDAIFKLNSCNFKEKKNSEKDNDNEDYIHYVTPLNGALLSIIQEALIKDNLSFAEAIEPMIQVSLTKDVIKERGFFEGDLYNYTFDYTAQKRAKKLISDYKAKNMTSPK